MEKNPQIKEIFKSIFVAVFLLTVLLSTSSLYAQNVGINSTGVTPNTSAMLDIVASDKGLLIPRVTLTQTTSNAPVGASVVTSLLVYNTATINDVTPGYYYWDGAKWVKFLTGSLSGDDWTILGNAGTVSGTNFLGTTDNQVLDIRTNNIIHTRITTKGQIEVLNTGNSVFVGEGAGAADDLSNNNNVLVGYNAGTANTTGLYNVAVGWQSFLANTTGAGNTAIGGASLAANTFGGNNTAIGMTSMYSHTSGGNNVAVGNSALYNDIDGQYNIAIGPAALYNNLSGDKNVAIGFWTLRNNTASENTAVGHYALNTNTSGVENTALGFYALGANTTGTSNTSVGYHALQSNTTSVGSTAMGSGALGNSNANGNSAFGYLSLNTNTSGLNNAAFGVGALFANNTGGYNTACGGYALYQNTTGITNVAVGYDAMHTNSTGNNSTAIGANALWHSNGVTNTAIGYGAGYDITSGNVNVLVGDNTGTNLTTASENVLVGHHVAYYMQTGSSNTALGYNALYNYGGAGGSVRPGGSGNVAIGKWAMFNPISGDYNVAVGFSAYSLVNTGTENVFIGRYSDVHTNNATSYAVAVGAFSKADADYATALGYRSYANTANTLILGQINGINGATSYTNVGIGTTVPIKRLHVIGDDGNTEDIVLEDAGGGWSYLHYVIRNKTGTGNMSYSFSQQAGNSHFAGIDLDPDDERLIIRNNYCTTNGFDNGVISFETRNPSGSAERVRIDNDGNLGVGTINARSKVNVAGGIGVGDGNGIATTHGAQNTIQINTDIYYGGAFDQHSGGLIYSVMPGGWTTAELRFCISNNWGTYNTASPALRVTQTACTMHGVNITSDKRLKTDIKDINYGLSTVMNMKPVSFKKHATTEIINGKAKLEDKGVEKVGFIAQDLYEIIPEVVFKPENSDKEFWAIDYSKISVITVKAIQEQQKQIEQQQEEILELTEKYNTILKLVEELMEEKNSGQ